MAWASPHAQAVCSDLSITEGSSALHGWLKWRDPNPGYARAKIIIIIFKIIIRKAAMMDKLTTGTLTGSS